MQDDGKTKDDASFQCGQLRFQQCMLNGAAAIAKVVVKAEAREDNWTVQEVGQDPQDSTQGMQGMHQDCRFKFCVRPR